MSTHRTLALLLVLSSTARAEMQPRHANTFQVGFNPAGAQISFSDLTPGGYKFLTDVAGRVKLFHSGLGIWVGGGLNFAYGTYKLEKTSDIQIHVFTMLTLNLMKISLVPFVRFGAAGQIGVLDGSFSGGGGGVRFGGGMNYWFTRNIGVGMDTNFTLGGASPQNGPAGFYGHWDFAFGMRAGF